MRDAHMERHLASLRMPLFSACHTRVGQRQNVPKQEASWRDSALTIERFSCYTLKRCGANYTKGEWRNGRRRGLKIR